MILAIDVGNTNIVLGCIDGGKILNVVRIHTDTRETEAEYTIKLKEIIYAYGMDIKAIDGAILSSVVPPVTEAIRRAVRQLTGLDCMVVGPGVRTGMNVRVDDPGTVAGDLIVGGVAAMHYYGAPAIVLDLGTATTATVIDGNGCFCGGAIMPGVKLSYGALAAGTSPAAGDLHHAAEEVHRDQHGRLHALRRRVRYCGHDRRIDRPHGRGAGHEVHGRRDRRARLQHRFLLPARDRL